MRVPFAVGGLLSQDPDVGCAKKKRARLGIRICLNMKESSRQVESFLSNSHPPGGWPYIYEGSARLSAAKICPVVCLSTRDCIMRNELRLCISVRLGTCSAANMRCNCPRQTL